MGNGRSGVRGLLFRFGSGYAWTSLDFALLRSSGFLFLSFFKDVNTTVSSYRYANVSSRSECALSSSYAASSLYVSRVGLCRLCSRWTCTCDTEYRVPFRLLYMSIYSYGVYQLVLLSRYTGVGQQTLPRVFAMVSRLHPHGLRKTAMAATAAHLRSALVGRSHQTRSQCRPGYPPSSRVPRKLPLRANRKPRTRL